jgi:hypothetical protein
MWRVNCTEASRFGRLNAFSQMLATRQGKANKFFFAVKVFSKNAAREGK